MLGGSGGCFVVVGAGGCFVGAALVLWGRRVVLGGAFVLVVGLKVGGSKCLPINYICLDQITL